MSEKQKVYIKLLAYCIWCEEEMDGANGKMICSKKCLKEMNKAHPESSYTMDDVATLQSQLEEMK